MAEMVQISPGCFVAVTLRECSSILGVEPQQLQLHADGNLHVPRKLANAAVALVFEEVGIEASSHLMDLNTIALEKPTEHPLWTKKKKGT
jgi:hypothetical protein